jgi:hypothetical protein
MELAAGWRVKRACAGVDAGQCISACMSAFMRARDCACASHCDLFRPLQEPSAGLHWWR